MQKQRYLVSLHLHLLVSLHLLCQKYICNKNFEKFHWLQKCEVTDIATCYCRLVIVDLLLSTCYCRLVIVDHLKILSVDLKERFSDLKQFDFPTWMIQPMLVDLSDILNMQYQEEFTEMQNDELKLYLI